MWKSSCFRIIALVQQPHLCWQCHCSSELVHAWAKDTVCNARKPGLDTSFKHSKIGHVASYTERWRDKKKIAKETGAQIWRVAKLPCLRGVNVVPMSWREKVPVQRGCLIKDPEWVASFSASHFGLNFAGFRRIVGHLFLIVWWHDHGGNITFCLKLASSALLWEGAVSLGYVCLWVLAQCLFLKCP